MNPQPQPNSVTAQIILLLLYLTAMWGIYFGHCVREWLRPRKVPISVRGERVIAIRKVVVAMCIFALPLAFLIRSLSIQLAILPELATYSMFTLAGTNITGSTFVVLSLWIDD